jgi:hypothetical protein
MVQVCSLWSVTGLTFRDHERHAKRRFPAYWVPSVQLSAVLCNRAGSFLAHGNMSIARLSAQSASRYVFRYVLLFKRKMSSLARLNHPWVWNALLELERNLKYSNWGYAYGNGLLSWLKALTCSDQGLLPLAGT